MAKQLTANEIESMVLGITDLFVSDQDIQSAIQTGLRAILQDTNQTREEAEALVANYIFEFIQKELPNPSGIWQSFVSGSVAAVAAVATGALIKTIHEPRKSSRKRATAVKKSAGALKPASKRKKTATPAKSKPAIKSQKASTGTKARSTRSRAKASE